MINLDSWLLFDKWAPFIKGGNKYSQKGIDIIDSCLTHQAEMSAPPSNNRNTSPRIKRPNAKYNGFVNKPIAYCPKCHQHVKHSDEGVVCSQCQAYWHYSCAGVTQEELDNNWSGIDYLCLAHREVSEKQILCDVIDQSARKQPALNNNDGCYVVPTQKNTGEVQLLVHRVHSYSLNPKTTVKKHLSNLDLKPKIQARDKEQQYYIKVCPPSYEILVANMIEFGKQWGISMKAGEIDNDGIKVGTQFNILLSTPNGLHANVSMNCHWTSSSIHLQLNKGSRDGWNEKLNSFSHFVTHKIRSALNLIEETSEFKDLKERMRYDLENKTADIADGKEVSLALTVDKPHFGAGQEMHVSELVRENVECHDADRQPDLSEINDVTAKQTNDSGQCVERANEGEAAGSPAIAIPEPQSIQNGPVGRETPQMVHEEKARQDLNAMIQDQRVLIAEKDQEIMRLKSEVRLLKNAKKELGLATTQINELEEKRVKIMKCKEQLGVTIQTLKQEKQTAENQIQVLQKTITSQRSTIELNGQLIKDLQLKVDNHKNLALTFMDEVYDRDDSGEANSDAVSESPNRCNAHLLNDMRSLEKEHKLLNDKLQEANQRLKEVEDLKNQRESDVQSKESVIESLKTEHRDLSLKKADEINGLKGMVRNLEAKVATDNEKINALQSELETFYIDKETFELEVASLQKKLVNTEAELCSANLLAEKLKSEATEPDVWNALKANLDSKDVLISELKESEIFLTEQISQLNREVQNLSKQVEVEKGVGRNQATEIKSISQLLAASKEQARKLITLNNELREQKLSMRTTSEACKEVNNVSIGGKDEDVEVRLQIGTNQGLHEAVRNNKLCIREINQHNSCRPRSAKGCPFSHEVPADVDNATRNSLMLLWSEKHRKCAYEFVLKGSCKDKENCAQCVSNKQKIESRSRSNQPKYCFSEIKQENSCPWGKDDCHFDHDIPDDLRNDQAAQRSYLQEKEVRRGKCVNEYRKEGSCRKGQDLCRFSHNISEEERADPVMQAQMKLKYDKMVNPDQKSSYLAPVNGMLTVGDMQKMFNQFLAQMNGTLTTGP